MATFVYQDKTVFYECSSEDKSQVLLLLNGIMMSTKSWDPFIDTFKKHVTVLRVDFFDQGQSEKMSENYTQTIQVEMLKALLDHLDIKKVYLSGISYGGSIALQFAAKYQDMVAKLMLFNATAKTSAWLKAIGDGWNAVAKSRDGEAYYHIAIPYIYSPHFYNKNIAWMEARKEKLIPLFSNPDFLDAITRLTISAETHDVSDVLRDINVKTLVVASTYDFLTPPFEQAFLTENMPNARMVTFETCGHASMYEQPELFVSTILGFIQEDGKYTI